MSPILDRVHTQNRQRYVCPQFTSFDQCLDKASFNCSNRFHAMQFCTMTATSRLIPGESI